jgi:hypothetical protein
VSEAELERGVGNSLRRPLAIQQRLTTVLKIVAQRIQANISPQGGNAVHWEATA